MEKLINKDFFLTINEGCLDNQMIRFIISDNNFLIPDLYNNFKGKEFLVKSTKEELKIFSENINEKYTKLFNKNNIVEVIENIILKHIIGIIGLARKAKKVVIGFDEIKIQLKKNKIYAETKEDYYITIDKKNIRNLKVSLNYNGPLIAPIQKGEKIGELIVLNKDEIIKKLPLYASEDLKKVNFFKSLITSINYLIWGDV